MIWNWDNIQHRAEYPDPSTLIFGHPVVWEVTPTRWRLSLVPSPAGGYDSEARMEELGR